MKKIGPEAKKLKILKYNFWISISTFYSLYFLVPSIRVIRLNTNIVTLIIFKCEQEPLSI